MFIKSCASTGKNRKIDNPLKSLKTRSRKTVFGKSAAAGLCRVFLRPEGVMIYASGGIRFGLLGDPMGRGV
jgi:hypothetical protein